MDGNYVNIGGQWVPAKPVKAPLYFRIESALRKRGFKMIASLMAWWDERKLGR